MLWFGMFEMYLCCLQVLDILYFDTSMKLVPGGFLPDGPSGTYFLARNTLHYLLLAVAAACGWFAVHMLISAGFCMSRQCLCFAVTLYLQSLLSNVLWCAGNTTATVTQITSLSAANRTCAATNATTSGALGMASFSAVSAAVLAAAVALVL